MMERSPFDWLRLLFARALTLLTDFRCEFRPIDSKQPSFLTGLTSVQRKHFLDDGESAFGPFALFWLVLFGLGCFASWGLLVLFPHHHVVFPFLQ